MQYYCINYSLNRKTVGIYPQVEQAIYHYDVDDPKFIGNIYFKRIDFEVKVANAVLRKQAKPTDIISCGIVGFNLKLLVSNKLRLILENFRATGIQFFRSPILFKGQQLENYWILNLYKSDMHFIDFKKSEVYLTENVFNNVKKLNVLNSENFFKEKNRIESMGYPNGIKIERFVLLDGIIEDFFALLDVEGGVKYIVSEKLKKEIEYAGCTGIEFMPVELTLNEWLHGERETIYGKA